MKMLLLIGCAGFAGTLLRWGGMRLVTHFCPNFPWGTLAVNITGAFAAGFCFILCRTKFPTHEANFPILFAGFFGAFTTFSTFALESARFLLDGHYGKFFANVLLQNAAGLAAACAGLLLAKHLFR